MDMMAGRNGKDAILTLTERLTDRLHFQGETRAHVQLFRYVHRHRPLDFISMEKPGHGREAAHVARTAIRLSLPYMGGGVKTMTTDSGSEFSAHGKITEAMKGAAVCFADPCYS